METQLKPFSHPGSVSQADRLDAQWDERMTLIREHMDYLSIRQIERMYASFYLNAGGLALLLREVRS